MTPLFKKLNFKDQEEIAIINSPEEFESELEQMKSETGIHKSLENVTNLGFVISFVKSKNEIDGLAAQLKNKIKGDPVIWFAYPKKTSKKYKVEINRDSGWESLRKIGLDTVRAVSIDDDWSALRFRKVEFIKNK
ncbi:MAG: hypothetical protein ACTHNG_01110 [Ginsengibacter sp.]